jgi:hypothetical protein
MRTECKLTTVNADRPPTGAFQCERSTHTKVETASPAGGEHADAAGTRG